ncbi:acetylcholinesterase-like [Amphiura filiformis]|uniref:acetylcholinesterase-like n=1 Tax=Amphiura filiformis TaxID=82378 RepID=UPI003B216164
MNVQQIGLCLVLLLFVVCNSNASNPTVTVDQGKLIGKRFQFRAQDTDFDVDAYLGIRYAEAAVGPLRFKPPVPKEWQGELNAHEYGYSCPQPIFSAGMPVALGKTSEDCLILNVYVPVPVRPNRAVMLWIHGGAYSIGAGSFAELETYPIASLGDVILVSINYRLGVFGFLATGDEVVPGNMGMLDQLEAMKWVQKNIEAFGGDPNRVTIFGESAGSGSVSLHTLSPLSKGLFSGAIMQSGVANVPWAVLEDKTHFPKRAFGIGKLVGCEKEDTKQLVDCLVDVPTDDLLNASQRMMEVFPEDPEMFPFAPVYDDHFISEYPDTLIKQRSFNPSNIMAGYNADEGTTIFVVLYPDSIEKPHINVTEFDNFMAASKLHLTPLQKDALELVYFDNDMLTEPNPNYYDPYIRIAQDSTFACSTDTYLRGAAEADVGSVYAYYFNHHPSKSIFNTPWSGACHADDLGFFGFHFTPNDFNMTDVEVEMTLKMIQYWTNFAKTGNPNIGTKNEEASSPAAKLLEWPQFTLDKRTFKELSPSMKNIPDPSGISCKLWNDYFPKLDAALANKQQECKSHWSKEDKESCSGEAKP